MARGTSGRWKSCLLDGESPTWGLVRACPDMRLVCRGLGSLCPRHPSEPDVMILVRGVCTGKKQYSDSADC